MIDSSAKGTTLCVTYTFSQFWQSPLRQVTPESDTEEDVCTHISQAGDAQEICSEETFAGRPETSLIEIN
jgi:hypothetical protein